MASHDPNELWPELEKLGPDEVLSRVAQGVYGERKRPVVEEWLRRVAPTRMYHPVEAPDGKWFRTDEVSQLETKGWYDSPDKFNPPTTPFRLKEFWLAHWKWTITTLITVIGVASAIYFGARSASNNEITAPEPNAFVPTSPSDPTPRNVRGVPEAFWPGGLEDYFVEIAPGPFTMGTDSRAAVSRDNEMPQHEVMVPRFFIGRYEVTVGQYRTFVDETGYDAFNGSLDGEWDYPVAKVSWFDAVAFCDWLDERLRSVEDLASNLVEVLQRDQRWVVTLPSEAEWEKAARGDDGRIYPWGNQYDPIRANYNWADTGQGARTFVGSFPAGASVWGVFDMAGNVEEWTRSLWGTELYRTRFPGHTFVLCRLA